MKIFRSFDTSSPPTRISPRNSCKQTITEPSNHRLLTRLDGVISIHHARTTKMEKERSQKFPSQPRIPYSAASINWIYVRSTRGGSRARDETVKPRANFAASVDARNAPNFRNFREHGRFTGGNAFRDFHARKIENARRKRLTAAISREPIFLDFPRKTLLLQRYSLPRKLDNFTINGERA